MENKTFNKLTIFISIGALILSGYSILISNSALKENERQNEISQKALYENIKINELDIIKNYSDVFANMSITSKLEPLFKLIKNASYKEEEIRALLTQLQGLINYYEEGKITNVRIQENFDTIIDFACYNIRGINITYDYPKLSKYCEENGYFK